MDLPLTPLQSINGRMLCKSVISICLCFAAGIGSVLGEIPSGFPHYVKLPLDEKANEGVLAYDHESPLILYDSWPTARCPGGIYAPRETKFALSKILPVTINEHNTDQGSSETGFGVVDEDLHVQKRNLIVKYKKYDSTSLKKIHFVLLDVWELVRLHFQPHRRQC